MYFESIKIFNGILQNEAYHIDRMNRTMQKAYQKSIQFSEFDLNIPEEFKNGLVKCRIEYDEDFLYYSFHNYQIRTITKLHIIKDDAINYPFKKNDRSQIIKHTKHFQAHEEAIFIINNMLSDSSFSNIALFNGTTWHTPITPLHYGTKRQQLINDKKIIEVPITLDDLAKYQKISFINALNDLGVCELEIRN